MKVKLVVTGDIKVKMLGIEVTQAVQTEGQPGFNTYHGVTLVKAKKTVARVFAGFTGTENRPNGKAARPDLGMVLRGYGADGQELPLSPILPVWSPSPNDLPFNDEFLSFEDRSAGNTSFVFNLPGTWTKRGPIRLQAQALGSNLPSPVENTLCVDFSCGAEPLRSLKGIPFAQPKPLRYINALEIDLQDPGEASATVPPAADKAFTKLQALSPVQFRFLNADDSPTNYPVYRAAWIRPRQNLLEATQDFDNQIDKRGDDTIGVFNFKAGRGVTIPGHGRTSVGTADPYDAAGDVDRPVTVIAMNNVDQLGLDHADSNWKAVATGCPTRAAR